MLKVSGHPNMKLREWGAQALTVLVKSALKVKNAAVESVSSILLLIRSYIADIPNICETLYSTMFSYTY